MQVPKKRIRKPKKVKPIDPNFKTPETDFSGEEIKKIESNYALGNLKEEFSDLSLDEITDVSATIAKSHGIYLGFDRAKTGKEKDWNYMIRMSIPGGGPLNREQWRILDDLSDRYVINPHNDKSSIRLTTRQNIQFHWIKKRDLIDTVRTIAETKFFTLNGCGDNARNVMGCPISRFSDLFDSNALAHELGRYFQLPESAHIKIFAIDPEYLRRDESEKRFDYGPNLMNRKFKIAVSAIHFDEKIGDFVPDNCVELRTNDVGIAPIIDGGKVDRFQIYIGGGSGERNGKTTFSALAQPFGIFSKDQVVEAVSAIATIHQEWGDRQNRHWARLKYVVHKLGVEWFQDRVRERIGYDFENPHPNHDIGDRHLHHGWMEQKLNGKLAFGAFIENGRVIDGPNGDLKKMVRHLMESYPIQILTTPNQDLIFSDIPPSAKEDFSADLKKFGFGERNGKAYSDLRIHSGACVGRDTCKLTYTDSEKFLPFLIDELDEKWGHLEESIGMTGCERQCFRPATKSIGWIGMGLDRYKLKIGGTEDARCQGEALRSEESENLIYLRYVPREDVPIVTDKLFRFYSENADPNEKIGYFFQRVGNGAIVEFLKKDPQTSELMDRLDNRY